MTHLEKMAIYDRISIALTNYENSEDTDEVNLRFVDEFYELLAEIQCNWDELISEEE